jgi:hypothetical protein
MTFMPMIAVYPAVLEINGSSTFGGQNAQWLQDSGRLFWSVTNDLVVNPSHVGVDGETMFSFNFTVKNWHKGQPGSLLSVQASLVDPWTRVSTAFQPPSASNPDAHFQTSMQNSTSWPHPLHLQTPKITKIWITQSSPYPCDTNVITVQIMTNTPIFGYCEPSFTISGLDGHDTNATLLAVQYLSSSAGMAANGSFSEGAQLNAMFWDAASTPSTRTKLRFGVDRDIPLKFDGGVTKSMPIASSQATLGFKFEITNQAQFQPPPALTVYAKYASSFKPEDLVAGWHSQYRSAAPWDTSAQDMWAVEDSHPWVT